MEPTLASILMPEGVVEFAEGTGKRDVLMHLGGLGCEAAGVLATHRAAVLDALWERETILSTGIGLGIAVPHTRHPRVPVEVMRVGRSRTGLAFDAIDGKPVHAVFTVLMPAGFHQRHVKVLAAIAAALKDPARRERVFAAEDGRSFVERMLGRA